MEQICIKEKKKRLQNLQESCEEWKSSCIYPGLKKLKHREIWQNKVLYIGIYRDICAISFVILQTHVSDMGL